MGTVDKKRSVGKLITHTVLEVLVVLGRVGSKKDALGKLTVGQGLVGWW